MNLYKRFIQKDLPSVYKFLNDKIVDLSTMAELVRVWAPSIKKPVPEKAPVRALEHVEASIKELQFYKARIFDPKLSENTDFT